MHIGEQLSSNTDKKKKIENSIYSNDGASLKTNFTGVQHKVLRAYVQPRLAFFLIISLLAQVVYSNIDQKPKVQTNFSRNGLNFFEKI